MKKNKKILINNKEKKRKIKKMKYLLKVWYFKMNEMYFFKYINSKNENKINKNASEPIIDMYLY